MRDTAIATAIVITCFALECFLFSIGWNLAMPSVFGVKQIGIAESFGVVVLLKIASLQVLGPIRKAMK